MIDEILNTPLCVPMFVCGLVKRRRNQLNKNYTCPALLSHKMDTCVQEVLIDKNT